jgi:hypothetical protein
MIKIRIAVVKPPFTFICLKLHVLDNADALTRCPGGALYVKLICIFKYSHSNQYESVIGIRVRISCKAGKKRTGETIVKTKCESTYPARRSLLNNAEVLTRGPGGAPDVRTLVLSGVALDEPEPVS